MSDTRTQAPFGRRLVPISWRGQYGAYVVLGCHDEHAPRPEAGQFYMIASGRRWGGGQDERPFLPRAFSVMRAPAGSAELEFLVEDVGPGTERLAELDMGDSLSLVGPLGSGFRPPREGRTALLVGGGVGIAPLVILQDQLAPNAPVLLGFRDAAHAPGAELLADPRVATDDGSVGHTGFVTELLAQELQRDEQFEVFACGPPAMLEATRLLCDEHETPAQLALESGMACGFGACFGCVVPTREGLIRLCVEGPVLDRAMLESSLLMGAAH